MKQKICAPVKLSAADKSNILKALTAHRIQITQQKLDWLLRQVEMELDRYKRSDDYDENIGRADMLAEIKRFRRVLKSLHVSTRRLLERCSFETRTYEELTRDYLEAEKDRQSLRQRRNPFDHIFSHSYDLLIECCDIVLKDGGPRPTFSGENVDPVAKLLFPEQTCAKNALDVFASKRGRKYNKRQFLLVRDLTSIFHDATGKAPTESPHGSFDEFVATVFSIAHPQSERTTFRKLIHRALIVHHALHMSPQGKSLTADRSFA